MYLRRPARHKSSKRGRTLHSRDRRGRGRDARVKLGRRGRRGNPAGDASTLQDRRQYLSPFQGSCALRAPNTGPQARWRAWHARLPFIAISGLFSAKARSQCSTGRVDSRLAAVTVCAKSRPIPLSATRDRQVTATCAYTSTHTFPTAAANDRTHQRPSLEPCRYTTVGEFESLTIDWQRKQSTPNPRVLASFERYHARALTNLGCGALAQIFKQVGDLRRGQCQA